MRDHPYLYPIVNVTHLFGMVLIVGGIGLLDLRLLGFARQIPLLAIYGLLTGAAAIGIVIQVSSGIPLFASDATALIGNDAFVLKMLLFAVALTNALAFRLLWRGHIAGWDRHPPLFGLVQAALSLMLWLSIAALGRWIAYA
ncbi:MAG: hypothetical protein FJX44_07900 [Alphaproteobacteria bacterium]|nr:hypothetical protein [Alphaproteobacteria bacterium]